MPSSLYLSFSLARVWKEWEKEREVPGTSKCQTMLMWNGVHYVHWLIHFFIRRETRDEMNKKKKKETRKDNVCVSVGILNRTRRRRRRWRWWRRRMRRVALHIEGYNMSGQTCLNNGYHTFTASLHQHLPTNLCELLRHTLRLLILSTTISDT